MKTTISFRVSDTPSFLLGLLTTTLMTQWWVLQPIIKEQNPGIDFGNEEIRRLLASQLIDMVTVNFGDGRAADDMRAMREDLVRLAMTWMEPDAPKGPHLRLVP